MPRKLHVKLLAEIDDGGPDRNVVLAITSEEHGAYPNGTRVEKCVDIPEDAHPKGAFATVIGSVHAPEMGAEFGYFVHWDDRPHLPCFVRGNKIRALACY